MGGAAPTLGNGFTTFFQLVEQIVYRWVPATVTAVAASGGPGGPPYASPPLGAPATPGDVANFLETASLPGAYDWLSSAWGVLAAISIFLSLLFAAITIYSVIRLRQVRRHERLQLEAVAHPVASRDVPRAHLRWQRILDEARSDDEQKWRLAILEADIMLNELLDVLGYKGETIADKMRGVEKANFNTIDMAWEAHRARNKIAHQGAQSPLSSKDAQRVISLYEKVFREFRFVP